MARGTCSQSTEMQSDTGKRLGNKLFVRTGIPSTLAIVNQAHVGRGGVAMEQLESGHTLDLGGADGRAKVFYKICTSFEGGKVTVRDFERGCGACRTNYLKVSLQVCSQTHLFGGCLLLGLWEDGFYGF